MLTEFGRLLRKIRIDHNEIIKNMAEKLNVTASYLSAVETGKRNIPPTWVANISMQYHLNNSEKIKLETAALNSSKILTLNMGEIVGKHREVAVLFAREFEGFDDDKIEQIRKILKNDDSED